MPWSSWPCRSEKPPASGPEGPHGAHLRQASGILEDSASIVNLTHVPWPVWTSVFAPGCSSRIATRFSPKVAGCPTQELNRMHVAFYTGHPSEGRPLVLGSLHARREDLFDESQGVSEVKTLTCRAPPWGVPPALFGKDTKSLGSASGSHGQFGVEDGLAGLIEDRHHALPKTRRRKHAVGDQEEGEWDSGV